MRCPTCCNKSINAMLTVVYFAKQVKAQNPTIDSKALNKALTVMEDLIDQCSSRRLHSFSHMIWKGFLIFSIILLSVLSTVFVLRAQEIQYEIEPFKSLVAVTIYTSINGAKERMACISPYSPIMSCTTSRFFPTIKSGDLVVYRVKGWYDPIHPTPFSPPFIQRCP